MEWKALIDLGVAGAALLIIYKVAEMLFRYLEIRGKSDSKGLDRLVAKLDTVVDSNNKVVQKMTEVMISNSKDQAQVLRILEAQQEIIGDILKKVVRIDVRTQSCLHDDERSHEHGRTSNFPISGGGPHQG